MNFSNVSSSQGGAASTSVTPTVNQGDSAATVLIGIDQAGHEVANVTGVSTERPSLQQRNFDRWISAEAGAGVTLATPVLAFASTHSAAATAVLLGAGVSVTLPLLLLGLGGALVLDAVTSIPFRPHC